MSLIAALQRVVTALGWPKNKPWNLDDIEPLIARLERGDV